MKRLRSSTDLREAQRKGIKFGWPIKKCAIWADMGVGKTGIAIYILAQLWNRLAFNRALVVATIATAIKTWPDEFAEWEVAQHISYKVLWDADEGSEVFHHYGEQRLRHFVRKYEKLTIELQKMGKGARGYAAKKRALDVTSRIIKWGKISARDSSQVHIINRENIQFLVAFWGKYWPYDTIIYDEAQGLRNGKRAKRWKAMKMVMNHTERMIQLSGTPIPNGYMGLWAQVFLLDGGERLGRTLTAYRERFFVQNRDGYNWDLLPGSKEEILDAIQDIVLVLRARDYMDLPDTNYIEIPVLMSEKAKAQYKQMAKEKILEFSQDDVILARSASALRMKLLQISSGFVYEDDKKYRELHNHRLDAMEAFVESMDGQPLLVAYWFKPDLERIKKRFPKAVVRDKRGTRDDDWNAGKIQIYLIHPASGGHGINIQYGSRTLLWYGPIDDLELYEQLNARLAEARAYGLGPTFIHHLVAPGTVDGMAMNKLHRKGNDQAMMKQYLLDLTGKRYRYGEENA